MQLPSRNFKHPVKETFFHLDYEKRGFLQGACLKPALTGLQLE